MDKHALPKPAGGNKETLIFLHGVGGHCESYAKNVVALSDEFHVVAYDYVGQGVSDKPWLEYTPMMLVEHLRELMVVLGVEKAHLSGESMGGWVSDLFTIADPDRVSKLNFNTAAGLPIITDKSRKELVELTSKTTTMAPHVAQRYEHSPDRVDTRAGNYKLKLHTKAGEVEVKVPTE